ncbi:MAG: hypothetical protein NC548_11180 [Lachnospiraceae bacterium]|nr:hypothetical protein [Lachnospiraceae bacterium]
MSSDFLLFSKPYLIATQVLVSKRELNYEEVVQYCDKPESVEPSGRKNLYKVIGDLFSLYKVDAPSDFYGITPKMLNTYANAYARYVLKRPVAQFDDIMGWDASCKDMYDTQNGKSYMILLHLLKLEAFGDDTLEVGMFIANTLALALNGQAVFLNKATYTALLQYIKNEEWTAVEELLMFYGRYREFLGREYAFAYYLYSATVQYGYADPNTKDDSLCYVFNVGKKTLRAKYFSGSSNWALTILDSGRRVLGTVNYTDMTTKCSAAGGVGTKLLASVWYEIPNVFCRSYAFNKSTFNKVFTYVNNNGKRHPLVARHLRNNFAWQNGNVTVITYVTGYSRMIHVRQSNKLVLIAESTDSNCYASVETGEEIIRSIDFVNAAQETPLEEVLEDYIKSKFSGEPSVHNVVAAICEVLKQYDVRGLEIVQSHLPMSKLM